MSVDCSPDLLAAVGLGGLLFGELITCKRPVPVVSILFLLSILVRHVSTLPYAIFDVLTLVYCLYSMVVVLKRRDLTLELGVLMLGVVSIMVQSTCGR